MLAAVQICDRVSAKDQCADRTVVQIQMQTADALNDQASGHFDMIKRDFVCLIAQQQVAFDNRACGHRVRTQRIAAGDGGGNLLAQTGQQIVKQLGSFLAGDFALGVEAAARALHIAGLYHGGNIQRGPVADRLPVREFVDGGFIVGAQAEQTGQDRKDLLACDLPVGRHRRRRGPLDRPEGIGPGQIRIAPVGGRNVGKGREISGLFRPGNLHDHISEAAAGDLLRRPKLQLRTHRKQAVAKGEDQGAP